MQLFIGVGGGGLSVPAQRLDIQVLNNERLNYSIYGFLIRASSIDHSHDNTLWKHLHINVTHTLHLTYSEKWGNLGLV